MMHCGKPMFRGRFVMEKRGISGKGSSLVYPVAAFYNGNDMICETPVDSTLGYYCSECGLMLGVFPVTHPTGFVGRFTEDINDKIDILPRKICPECGAEIDVDYPRCPFCGHIYEVI